MRALITGIGGFVGGHLALLLRREGHDVWGIDRLPASDEIAGSTAAIELGDVCDSAFTRRVVRVAQPTHVFHLAWDFDQNRSEDTGTVDRNVLGLSVLLEAVGVSAGNARMLVASSSAVYGAPDTQPITEDASPRPATKYGASELALEAAAASFRLTEGATLKPTTSYGINKAAVETTAEAVRGGLGLDIVITRTFNALGPGMPRRLFAGSLAAQIAAAELGRPHSIEVGRLDSSRDYVDVRDAVRAYLGLATHPHLSDWVFNVCTGVSHNGRELADEMMAHAKVPVTLHQDPSRIQAGDVNVQVGCAERLRLATGWTPTISFSESVRDTLEHARKLAG